MFPSHPDASLTCFPLPHQASQAEPAKESILASHTHACWTPPPPSSPLASRTRGATTLTSPPSSTQGVPLAGRTACPGRAWPAARRRSPRRACRRPPRPARPSARRGAGPAPSRPASALSPLPTPGALPAARGTLRPCPAAPPGPARQRQDCAHRLCLSVGASAARLKDRCNVGCQRWRGVRSAVPGSEAELLPRRLHQALHARRARGEHSGARLCAAHSLNESGAEHAQRVASALPGVHFGRQGKGVQVQGEAARPQATPRVSTQRVQDLARWGCGTRLQCTRPLLQPPMGAWRCCRRGQARA